MLGVVLFIALVLTLFVPTYLAFHDMDMSSWVTGDAIDGSVQTCINNPPEILFNCSTDLFEGAYYSCQLDATDFNDDILYYYQNTTSGNLTFNLYSNGTITVTPNSSTVGISNLTFTVIDERNCSNSVDEVNVSFTVQANNIIYPTYPEGFYYLEPSPLPAAGNYLYNFTIPFDHITGTLGDIVGCYINQSNCYDDGLAGCRQIFANTTLTSNITDGNVSVTYVLVSSDSINSTGNGTSDNWIPWRVLECGHYNASLSPIVVNDSVNWNIHVRPITWTLGDIANSVNAKSAEDMFAQNTIKADQDGDVAFAVSKYGGTNVELFCHDEIDNPTEPDSLIDTADPECWGVTYSNKPKQSFANTSLYYSPSGSHGTLANDIPIGDMEINTTSFSSSFGETSIEYTQHTMPNGTFKMRLSHWSVSKTATIFVRGFPQIENVTKIFPGTGSSNGEFVYFLDKNNIPVDQDTLNESETHTNQVILRSYQAGGTEIANIDTTLLIYFNESNVSMDEGYIIELTLNYLEGLVAYEDTVNITIYFDDLTYIPIGDSRPRWSSDNNNEWEIRLNDPSMTWDSCNDTKNGDFDYLDCSGNEQYCFDFQSYDCYDIDCNTKPGPPAHDDYYTNGDTTGRCGYGGEYIDAAACFDQYNNDWALEDDMWGHANTGLTDIDCRDKDCDVIINPSNATQVCQYKIELNCTDGFDNDYWQELDCEGSLTGSYNDAEYDCSSHCRATLDDNELGSECNDGVDNDWDLWYTTTGGANGYSFNLTSGAGMDCHWGGYFSYGSDNHPDEDCGNETLSNGKVCELERELNCYDEFDNDYDSEAGSMPNPGWTNNQTLYALLFNQTFSNDADFDDYDCADKAEVPSSEALNASWCFDNIDNDMDAYYWNGAGYSANASGGIDCSDPNCIGVANPENVYDVCLDYEFNASDAFFFFLPRIDFYCDNNIDDDLDGPKDCFDPDCYQAFGSFGLFSNGICYACPNIELTEWDACADGSDNDYDSQIDENDADCLYQLSSYDHQFYLAIENNAYLCSDNYDNDGDGQVDCQDSDCLGFASCSAEVCNDDIDNDGDGSIDCVDSDCAAQAYCIVNTLMTGTYVPPSTSSQTFDGLYALWDNRVRLGNNFTIQFTYGSYSSTAYLWLGNLLGVALPVHLGLQGENFITTGSTQANFETQSYSEDGSNTKGQIVLQDAVNGSGASSISMTVNIPTNDTIFNDAFELYFTIAVPSTGHSIDFRILDNISPTVNLAISEPSASSVNISYGSGVWFGVSANDTENGDYQDGTIDRCFYNASGPNSYLVSGDDASDCKFTIGNMVESGTYNFSFWARDDTGNYATAVSESKTINIIPAYKSGSFLLTNNFYNSSLITISVSSQFYSDDSESISKCNVYYQATNGSVVNAGTIPASYSGDLVTCSGSITTPSDDNLYGLWTGIYDLDLDPANSTKESFFICNNYSSSGVGTNGELWNCTYAPANLNEACDFVDAPLVTLVAPTDNTQSTSTTQTFTCNVTSNTDLYNFSLSVWNANTGVIFYENSISSSGNSDSNSWIVSGLPLATYEWNCLAYDVYFASSWATTNNTLKIGTTTTPPGGGGGGGGFCTPNWFCPDWSPCNENGTKNRTCVDNNSCYTNNELYFEESCEQLIFCENGIQDEFEEGVDCGGECKPCASCNDGIKNQGEEDIDCGGLFCDVCKTCFDGIFNNFEEEIDCGGPFCVPCKNCFDGIQNYGELGVDCGGPCEPCGTCFDGIKNQNEKGVDCGGSCEACKAGELFDNKTARIIGFGLLALILLGAIKIASKYGIIALGHKAKQVLLTAAQKKQLLRNLSGLEKESVSTKSVDVPQHKLSLLFTNFFGFIFTNSRMKENNRSIEKLSTTNKVKKSLKDQEEIHKLLSKEELLSREELLLSLELFREQVLSISKTETEDVARSINEMSLSEEPFKRVQELLYNATLALEFDELLISKKKYSEAVKIYETLSEEEKEKLHPFLQAAFAELDYSSTFTKEK